MPDEHHMTGRVAWLGAEGPLSPHREGSMLCKTNAERRDSTFQLEAQTKQTAPLSRSLGMAMKTQPLSKLEE